MVGCFLLLGSSVTITMYHHFSKKKKRMTYIFLSIALGLVFIVVQFVEFYECESKFLYSPYRAIRFCVVGLHLRHVLVGLLFLGALCVVGSMGRLKVFYRDVGVWYWHFVDYIWLVVYLVVYVIFLCGLRTYVVGLWSQRFPSVGRRMLC